MTKQIINQLQSPSLLGTALRVGAIFTAVAVLSCVVVVDDAVRGGRKWARRHRRRLNNAN